MKNFEKIKQQILKKAKENNACTDQYIEALKSNNINELFTVVCNNYKWCKQYYIIDNLPKGLEIGGSLYLRVCDLKGITLPIAMGI